MKLFNTLIFCLLTFSIQAQVKFNLPLKGTPGKDFYIVNYVDHDTTHGLRDAFCGDKTYDGHTGTDMVLRSWKQADSGVAVYAAADGVVFKTKDSLFDRNKHGNTQGFGNYIAINHNWQLYTYYAHLRAGSLKVKYLDNVKAGQLLGYVACSGNCTDPHLHFEVWDNTSLQDPFSGKCQKNASLWNSQPAYDTSFKIIESGFVPYVPNLDTLRERYAVKDTFSKSDSVISFWLLQQGIRKGDSTAISFYTPAGTYWYSYGYYTHTSNWWYDYDWSYIYPKSMTATGLWTARYYVNGKLTHTKPFYFSPTTGTEATQRTGDNLHVFPNPAQNELTIENMGGPAPYQIINSLGIIMKSGILNSNKLSLIGLKAGIYTIRIGEYSRIIMKQ